MKNYINYKGRGKRLEFWVGTLAGILILLASYSLFYLLFSKYGELGFVVRVLFFIFNLSVLTFMIVFQIRRWHDRNKSGWWVLLNLVPVIGWVWPLVECGFLPGRDAGNRWKNFND